MNKPTFRTTVVLLLTFCFMLQGLVFAQADTDINAKIRKEGSDNSKIMWTMHYLSDIYGPG